MSSTRVRLRQLGVVAVGVVLAGVMVLLGLWQLDVYRAQGNERAAAKAAEPPVMLETVARAGAAIGDGYGRRVSLAGAFLAEQVEVPVDGADGRYRVVTALRMDNGDVVAVVRGVAGAGVPAAPSGAVSVTGLLLPSEEEQGRGQSGDGGDGLVRVTTLAQTWPGPMVAGVVTLSPADATAQGLEPASVVLPEASGRLRNGAYALQWWVFAGFALVLAGRIARDQAHLLADELPEITPVDD